MDEQVVGVFVSGMQIFRAIKLDEDAPDQPDATKFGYRLVGPRGQEYYLMRVNGQPHMMLAMDMKRRIKAPAFGSTIFTDAEKELKVATAR